MSANQGDGTMPRFLQFFRRRRRSSSTCTSKHLESQEDAGDRSRRAPPRSLSMHSMERSKSSDSLTSVASTTDLSILSNAGVLETFATIITIERTRRRHSGKTMRMEKLVMTPYFGHFAGQRIYFDLKRTADFMVNIKVRNEEKVLASLLHRQGRKKETVRDQCIKFAHETTAKVVNQNPASLSFLCEQTIILNLYDTPYWLLPTRYQSKYEIDCHVATVRVFPSSLYPSPIIMKLKKNISIRELQWMLSKKLRLSPSAITLYIKNSLETLHSLSPLPEDVVELACIVTPQAQYLRTDTCMLSVCVSMIGGNVQEVVVQPTTTLHEFEEVIKNKFGLPRDSFLYIPSVLSWHNGLYNSHCPLRMHAVLDSNTSSVLLLDHHRRNFPTLHGHLTVSEQQTLKSLLLYQTTIHELDLLKSGPIICFEVKGPTIPIAFKTMTDLDSDPTHFSLVDIRPHAVSVNADWSIPVLLKYLTCISGFPCNIIKLGEKVLQTTVANDLLQFEWFSIENSSHYVLPSCIPCAHP